MKLKHPKTEPSSNIDRELLDENAELRAKIEKLEARSQDKDERIKALTSQIKLGFWEWNQADKCAVNYSEEMAAIYGYELDEFYRLFKVVEDFYGIIHPEDLEHYKLHANRNRDSEEFLHDYYSYDYRIIGPDNQVRHLREVEYGVLRDKETLTNIYGVIQDITEYKQAIESLKQSEQRYASLVSQLPIGVQEEDYTAIKRVVDKLLFKGVENLQEYLENHPGVLRKMVASTHITNVNETMLRIHEADSEQEFLDTEANIDEWWDAEWVEFYAAEISGLAGPSKSYEAERVDTRVDGSYFQSRSITRLVRGYEDSWSRVITMHEDITDRKLDQLALIEAKTQAEAANAAKSEFLSCMSHELRTPLNAILGYSQLFESAENIDRKLLKNARSINHAGKHLLKLIDEILDLGRIESGESEIAMVPVSLGKSLGDSIDWVEGLAQSRGISIHFDAKLVTDTLVMADALKLKQVFLNLLTNAVKYNREGGSVQIRIDPVDNNRLRIGIEDTGPGILQDQIDGLFQPFNRLGAEFSGTEGTGIGLVITQKLVRLMNGELEVESTPGEGSLFSVELALVGDVNPQAVFEADKTTEIRLPNKVATNRKTNILVAEDNAINQDLIGTQLQTLGCNADIADDGAKALELWQKNSYDLLITDIRMPNMDGAELARRIRTLEKDSRRETPIIAITANAMDRDLEKCRLAGIDEVLAKPVDLNQLSGLLQKCLPESRVAIRHDIGSKKSIASSSNADVDLEILSRSVGDKPEVHRDLLSSFLQVLPGALEDIQIASSWRNLDQMTEHVHKLKSSSRSMGAVKLADLCQVIETASRESRWPEIESSLPELEKAAEQTQKFIIDFCDSREAFAPASESGLVEDEITDINLRILVVDDDFIMHKMATLIFNDLGIREVYTALSGQHALELLDDLTSHIDVVICDLNMPEMDGVEFTRHLAKRKYSGSLIITSGEDIRILKTVEKLAIEHELHVLGVMEKPPTPTKIINMLRLLDQVKSEKSIIASQIITVDDLARAIKNQEMDTFFQPKVDVQTGRVVGVEALVRWNHPSEGVISPNAFVTLAEENNLIRALTLAVSKKALQHAVSLQQKGFELNISINLSVDALNDLSWPDEMIAEIDACGLKPSSITFEITESRLMEHLSVALDILSRLSLKRFNLSIDDFGTGYSSMEQLQRIPFSELKIDRAFVRGASEDTSARAILESNVLLAKKLDMKIVAEGVETQRDWDLVAELGCDQVQGYFIARPMPIDALCDWLEQYQRP